MNYQIYLHGYSYNEILCGKNGNYGPPKDEFTSLVIIPLNTEIRKQVVWSKIPKDQVVTLDERFKSIS